MDKWNLRQRQLVADYLNNISAGLFILGVITPFLSGVTIDAGVIIKIIFSLSFSIMIIALAIISLKK